MLPSLLVVPATRTVSPGLSADTDTFCVVVTAVDDEVVTVTVVPSDSVIVKLDPLIEVTWPASIPSPARVPDRPPRPAAAAVLPESTIRVAATPLPELVPTTTTLSPCAMSLTDPGEVLVMVVDEEVLTLTEPPVRVVIVRVDPLIDAIVPVVPPPNRPPGKPGGGVAPGRAPAPGVATLAGWEARARMPKKPPTPTTTAAAATRRIVRVRRRRACSAVGGAAGLSVGGQVPKAVGG